jgi:hypothetical protein
MPEFASWVREVLQHGRAVPELHYMLPPEPRLPEGPYLIDEGQYFVVHAPRQTGKTTTLGALARDLTAAGRHVVLLFSCETAEVAGVRARISAASRGQPSSPGGVSRLRSD